MKTAVVIPVFNEGVRTLAPIHAAQDYPEVDEVIVVDDGSTDKTAEFLSNIDGITLLSHPINRGKGEALNTGIVHAIANGHDSTVFLDGDLIGIESYHIKELLFPLEDSA